MTFSIHLPGLGLSVMVGTALETGPGDEPHGLCPCSFPCPRVPGPHGLNSSGWTAPCPSDVSGCQGHWAPPATISKPWPQWQAPLHVRKHGGDSSPVHGGAAVSSKLHP